MGLHEDAQAASKAVIDDAVAAWDSQRAALEARILELGTDGDQARDDLAAAVAQVASLTAELDMARGDLTDAQAELSTATGRIAALTAQLNQARDQVATLTTERDQARAELAACRAGQTTFLFGASMYDNRTPQPLEDRAGRPVGVRRTYWNYTQSGGLAVAADDLNRGRVPHLSYKVHVKGDDITAKWAAAAAGSVDAWATKLAADLGALLTTPGRRIMLSIHHEPEGDGDLAQWKAMQRRLAPIFAAKGIEFGTTLTGWNQLYSGNAAYSLDALWPGDDVPVDFVAFDVYQSYGQPKSDGSPNRRWTDLEEYYFKTFGPWCAGKGVAWGFAETGLSDLAWDEVPAAKTWFVDTPAAMRRHGGSFFAYFNTTQNSSTTWYLTPGSTKEAAFVEALRQA